MKAKQPSPGKTYLTHILYILGPLVIALVGLVLYATFWNHTTSVRTSSRLAYVDGSEAAAQVSNFYRQYLDNAAKPDVQRTLVSIYGDQNLAFYNDYYQHGFNPITCSADMPASVTATLASTGPVATVKVRAMYPSHTTATITVKVVLTNELKIDSITCPGAKGNLPPGSVTTSA